MDQKDQKDLDHQISWDKSILSRGDDFYEQTFKFDITQKDFFRYDKLFPSMQRELQCKHIPPPKCMHIYPSTPFYKDIDRDDYGIKFSFYKRSIDTQGCAHFSNRLKIYIRYEHTIRHMINVLNSSNVRSRPFENPNELTYHEKFYVETENCGKGPFVQFTERKSKTKELIDGVMHSNDEWCVDIDSDVKKNWYLHFPAVFSYID